MKELEIEDKLYHLVEELKKENNSCHERLACLAIEASVQRKEINKSLDILQELVNILSLKVKYMVFDLEATYREKDYLMEMFGKLGNESNE